MEVMSRQGLLARGFTSRQLSRLVATGALTRPCRGVYAAPAAGVAALDPRAVALRLRGALACLSATAWWGVDVPVPLTAVHLAVPRSRGRRVDEVAGVRLHRSDVARRDVTVARGVRLTTPLRTALDVARWCDVMTAVAVLDGFVRSRLVDHDELLSATGALRGRGRAAAVAAVSAVDGRAESVLESMSRMLLALAGVAMPLTQFNVVAPDGRWLARVDFAWPQWRVILECDGFEHHSSREAFERDRRRWAALTAAGWRVVVVTWRDVVQTPDYVVGLVTSLLADQAA